MNKRRCQCEWSVMESVAADVEIAVVDVVDVDVVDVADVVDDVGCDVGGNVDGFVGDWAD